MADNIPIFGSDPKYITEAGAKRINPNALDQANQATRSFGEAVGESSREVGKSGMSMIEKKLEADSLAYKLKISSMLDKYIKKSSELKGSAAVDVRNITEPELRMEAGKGGQTGGVYDHYLRTVPVLVKEIIAGAEESLQPLLTEWAASKIETYSHNASEHEATEFLAYRTSLVESLKQETITFVRANAGGDQEVINARVKEFEKACKKNMAHDPDYFKKALVEINHEMELAKEDAKYENMIVSETRKVKKGPLGANALPVEIYHEILKKYEDPEARHQFYIDNGLTRKQGDDWFKDVEARELSAQKSHKIDADKAISNAEALIDQGSIHSTTQLNKWVDAMKNLTTPEKNLIKHYYSGWVAEGRKEDANSEGTKKKEKEAEVWLLEGSWWSGGKDGVSSSDIMEYTNTHNCQKYYKTLHEKATELAKDEKWIQKIEEKKALLKKIKGTPAALPGYLERVKFYQDHGDPILAEKKATQDMIWWVLQGQLDGKLPFANDFPFAGRQDTGTKEARPGSVEIGGRHYMPGEDIIIDGKKYTVKKKKDNPKSKSKKLSQNTDLSTMTNEQIIAAINGTSEESYA